MTKETNGGGKSYNYSFRRLAPPPPSEREAEILRYAQNDRGLKGATYSRLGWDKFRLSAINRYTRCGRNLRLLAWGLVRGRCPHPPRALPLQPTRDVVP